MRTVIDSYQIHYIFAAFLVNDLWNDCTGVVRSVVLYPTLLSLVVTGLKMKMVKTDWLLRTRVSWG